MSVAAPSTLEPNTLAFTPSAGRTWRTGLTSTCIAVAVNLAVLGVALRVGAAMVAAQNSIGVFAVSVMTVVPLLVATLVLRTLRRWGARAWRVLATTGLAIGLLSSPAPFTVSAEDPTRVALAAMHVITGVVWFLVVRRAVAQAEG